ncbi:MAG TPA: hydroxysqualene dehydroxylase HpnE [Actinomycetes bacterium]|nr:hydroxysqualene dehydroxylase HpnE [Actinomycetes bacterium]
MGTPDRPVAVVGGGLAGIAAALAVADAGVPVTLLEARPRLGGATFSFRRAGMEVDNGQHVFLRCCTAYLGLLQRLGVGHLVALQPRLAIPVLTPGGQVGWLRRSGLPAPLHLAGTLARYPFLSWPERLRAARAAAALRRLDPADGRLDRQTFGHWLAAHGQRARAAEALWDLLARPALNLPAGAASLALAVKVFRTGLLDARDAADLGWPLVPLARLHGEPAGRALAAAGVQVRLAEPVAAVEADADGLWLRAAGRRLAAAAVVLAVPHGQAARLLPAAALPQPGRLTRLGDSPIVDVHVVYERPVTDLAFAAGLGTPVPWVFDRTAASGLERGQYLVVSVSAADAEADRPTAQLRARYLPALAELFPAARGTRVVDCFVTRERAATFRQAPGTAALRPPARTGVPGLVLAGAWTATGWPATMEGAVRSGLAAAREALLALGRSRNLPPPGSSALRPDGGRAPEVAA